ncbi:MAG TPA: HK97-gp10 family putative phage morphogenesis protein [Anaerolineales bacterium]
MPRPNFRNAKNIQARLRIDPRSLAEHNRKLQKLAAAVRAEVVKQALLAGGGVIKDAALQKAPGPHIGIEVMPGSQLSKKWRSAGSQGIKPDGLYVAVGPDADHWYYRFPEYGVKAHGVARRKRTRKEIQLRAASPREARSAIRRQFAGRKPAMVFSINGKLIFTRKVRGFAAKPFLKPAAENNQEAAIQELGNVLGREIEKAARS